MNILQIKYLLAICLLPILVPIQVFSQNQSSHQLINKGELKQSSSAFSILVKEELAAGEYDIKFNSHSGDVGNLSRGFYFYQIKAEGFIQTKKMILIK